MIGKFGILILWNLKIYPQIGKLLLSKIWRKRYSNVDIIEKD